MGKIAQSRNCEHHRLFGYGRGNGPVELHRIWPEPVSRGQCLNNSHCVFWRTEFGKLNYKASMLLDSYLLKISQWWQCLDKKILTTTQNLSVGDNDFDILLPVQKQSAMLQSISYARSSVGVVQNAALVILLSYVVVANLSHSGLLR